MFIKLLFLGEFHRAILQNEMNLGVIFEFLCERSTREMSACTYFSPESDKWHATKSAVRICMPFPQEGILYNIIRD